MLSFLVPLDQVANTGLALTCRSFHAMLLTIASNPPAAASHALLQRANGGVPAVLQQAVKTSCTGSVHDSARLLLLVASASAAAARRLAACSRVPRPPLRLRLLVLLVPLHASSIPSKYKLQKSLILQATAAGIPVDSVISEPWWELDQAAVDVMRLSLINLLTPPRSPLPSLGISPRSHCHPPQRPRTRCPSRPRPPSSLPLSPREVAKWKQLMLTVDRGYVKQLRRRRLRAKQQAGVKGEELDAAKQRLARSSSGVLDLSMPALEISVSATSLSFSASSSPRSPALPGHIFQPPPLPPFLPPSSASAVSYWQQQVLPRWDEMRRHPLTLRLWGKEGVPAECRREMWKLSIGNERGITDDVFRQYWRGDEAELGEEEVKREDDEQREDDAAFASAAAAVRRSSSASSTPSSPSSHTTSQDGSPPSPSTPLPDAIHAFSLPAVALMAAESSLSNQIDALPAASRRASIHNDLLRMFDSAHQQDVAVLDAARTAAGLPPLFSSVHGLLATFSVYAPETSYVQGMSYMVVLLLLYLPVSEAFVCLCSLLRHDWYAAYMHMNVSAMQARCAAFSSVLRHNLPRLHQHLIALPPDTYFVEWMLTFYIPLLSFAFTSALLDLYLLQGEEVIYRTGIALMGLAEQRLLGLSLMDCSHWLRGGMRDDGGVDEDELWRRLDKVVMPPMAKAFFGKGKKKQQKGKQ